MLPADQALGAADLGATHIDDRLVVHDQLFLIERAAEVAEQAQALPRVAVQAAGVQVDATVGVLRGVHRHVCAAQQRVGVIAVEREARDAHACPDLKGHLLDLKGALHDLDDLPCVMLELLRVGRVLGREDRKLIAAHPRDDAVGPDALDQTRAQFAQQLVAVVVAERVVDLLEAVQVQQHHRKRLLSAAGAR